MLTAIPVSVDASFDWAVVAATIAGATIAGGIALLGYRYQQNLARAERRANIYSEAIRAVEDYLEAPYRILRKDGTSEARRQITNHISDVKSRISYYTALLELHCPNSDISDLYGNFVAAARQEAGEQMKDAWNQPPVTSDGQVSLGQEAKRSKSDSARTVLVNAMARGLEHSGRRRRWARRRSA